MATALSVKYHDVAITYDESRDVWLYELRGQERSSESLAKAKTAIDRPSPKDKKPFARKKAWQKKSYDGCNFTEVEVTCLAGKGWRGEREVWIVGVDKKERSKVPSSDLYEDTEANRKKIAALTVLYKQMKDLRDKATKLVDSMAKIALPEPEKEEPQEAV